jgi:large subunit ribosomal protein L35
MPKLKTKKGLTKRIRTTASGKLRHAAAYKGHILTKKSKSRKRRLRRGGLIHKHQYKIIRRLMPYI